MEKQFYVRMTVYGFKNKEQAAAFSDKLTDLFMEMPEAADLAAVAQVKEDERHND